MQAKIQNEIFLLTFLFGKLELKRAIKMGEGREKYLKIIKLTILKNIKHAILVLFSSYRKEQFRNSIIGL